MGNRISRLSSNQEAFSKSAPLYEAALHRSHYPTNLRYSPNNKHKNRTRKRNIIWFNPPFSKNVRTNVGRNFLNLIDKHFPASNPLHKIFNRNSVKVSYSCMDNCKSVISKHNFGPLLKNKSDVVASTKKNCNCIESTECPLNNNCLTKSVVYKAEVTDDTGVIRDYIGMTSNTFKKRFYNHKTSFKDTSYVKSTELSKHIWNLKNKKRTFNIKWSILKQASPYRSGAKSCNLCIQEKLEILKGDKKRLLNRRCELFSKCCHRKQFLAGKFERAHAIQSRK